MAQSLSDAIQFGSALEVIRGFFTNLSDEQKKDVANAPDVNGDTPLHFAAYKKKLYVVMMLVGYGADVNAENNAGSTPLHKAVLGGAEMVVDKLLEKGAKFVDNKNGLSPIDYARRDRAMWTRLSSKVTVINTTLETPSPYLPYIIGAGGRTIDMILTETGTNINKSRDGNEEITTLHLSAIKEAHIEAAKVIIEKKIEEAKEKTGANSNIPFASTKPSNEFKAYSERLTVPKEKRGILIGKGGETLSSLMRKTNTNILFPPLSEKSDQIIIEGDPKEVAHAKKEISALLKSVQPNHLKMGVVKHVEIPRADAGKIIGKAGATRIDLETTYGVQIKINAGESATAKIDVRGQTLGLVDAAVLAIIDLIEESGRREGGRGRGGGNGGRQDRQDRGKKEGGQGQDRRVGGGRGGQQHNDAPQKPKKEGGQKKPAATKLDDLSAFPALS